MRIALGLFIPVAAAIAGIWWWLGAPVGLPPTPLAADQKYYCVSYAPFRGSQTPFDPAFRASTTQIEEDLRRLAQVTDCVRTYAVNQGLEQVPEIAQRHGLKVLLGVWLGREAERNRTEIATAVALAKRFPDVIRGIVVGNETLLRGELSATDIAGHIRRVKSQVSVPVTYADVWEFWMRNRDLANVVDFITIHILPYWEDFPIPVETASAHVDAIRMHVADTFPGREILIGEVGWPSAGRMREGALPSRLAQARFIQEVLALARRGNYRVNLIEAFDQPWKRQLEGTVGGHWGLLDADTREPKFVLGAAVSNHPHWRLQAAGGIAFAAMVFAAAFAAARGRKEEAGLPVWAGTAVMALAGGSLIGWTLENVPLESLGPGGWARSLTLAALALLSAPVAAAALARGTATPSFAAVLSRADERPRDRMALGLGLLLIVLTVVALEVTLALVFNPRYRDFYFAPLTAAVVPFLVLSLLGARLGAGRPVAETIAAVVLAGAVVYIVPNEGIANWQALWFSAAMLGLAVILFRARGAQSSGS